MDRTAFADFLRRRRQALQPVDVGLPACAGRRASGLRREEVAALAAISRDYYTRLEQRRGARPSEQVLTSLARAQADGADLAVVSATESEVTIRLIGSDETCWDCIVPPDQLRTVIDSVLRRSVGALETVDLIDPRDAS